VLPPPVEEKVAAVAGDHQSGATHLAERALRAFDLLVASGSVDRPSVQELARRLEEAQPAMASVRTVARLAAKFLLENPQGWPMFVGSMQRSLDDGRPGAGRDFVKSARVLNIKVKSRYRRSGSRPQPGRVVLATERYGDVDLRCYKERFRRRLCLAPG